MPDPLVLSIRIALDAASRPPGTPLANSWFSRYAEKSGYRWKPGDDRQQVLPYTGTVWKSRLVSKGTPSSVVTSYREPAGASARCYYSGNNWTTSPPTYAQQAWNKAYERFKDVALGENATWGTTIAEGREALGLIGSRALTLFQAYRALKKGDFRYFLRKLGIQKPLRKHKRYTSWHLANRKSTTREIARNASGLWLEYWFGWSPLAGEIYQSTVALTAAEVPGRHWGSAWQACPARVQSAGTTGSKDIVSETGKYVVKTGGTVRYLNYDRMLTQQMGLANPLAIAWELVPFSFVVDWFTNVGDVLGSLTDFRGVELSNTFTTEFIRTVTDYQTTYLGSNPSTYWKYEIRTYRSRRRTALIKPVLVTPRLTNFGDSLTRTATAVSLLVQIFSKK